MNSAIKQDCSIVISTCDGYSDIWDPFFTLFSKFWPDNPYPVFANSETLDCSTDKVAVTTLKACTAGLSWTRRLKEALERIDTDYIIFMLDDFFLYGHVDTGRIEEYVSHMRNNPDMGAIYFIWLGSMMKMEECSIPELEKCSHTGNRKVNLTLAIWKKDAFCYYLNHDESAWEFEANALERSLDRKDTFFSVASNAPITMPYKFSNYGLFAGKWFRDTVELFNKNGIEHDFAVRGFYNDYEYGLIPYVAKQIKMNSYLVPCYSLTCDQPRINTKEIVEEGYFCQTYDVSGSRDAAIWYPSSFHGYAVENFTCTIMFKSGETEILTSKNVWGVFTEYHNVLYFLHWGVCVYLFPKVKREMARITIEGWMNKHCDKNELSIIYDMPLKATPTSIEDLYHLSKIYAELMTIPDNYISFRMCSKLCFKCGASLNQKVELLDGKDRFPGRFVQTYVIEKLAELTVRWEIGGSRNGFAIEALQVELVYDDGEQSFLDTQALKGNGTFENGYWIFVDSNAYLLLTLPENCPQLIRISGNLVAPIPRMILQPMYQKGNGGNKIQHISKNEKRIIISLIKKNLKKYGFFGVVKKAGGFFVLKVKGFFRHFFR